MDFLSQHIIPPSALHMKLLEFLAVVTYTIHLPFIALVVGSTAVALWLTFSDHEIPNPRFARLAGDLIATVLGRRVPLLVLGIMPLLVLPFIYGQWFVGLEKVPMAYIVLPMPGVALGLFLLGLYGASFKDRATGFARHMGLGLLGLGTLMGSYFVMMSAITRLQDPEKWYRLKNVVILVLNWNVIWKFLLFVHLGFGLTGAAMLFFILRWRSDAASDPEYANFVRRFGAGLGLAFCFAVPVFNLFYVFTSADVTFDSTVYVLGAAVTLVTMFIAYAFLGALRSQRARFGATTFTLFIVVFVLSSTFDVRSMANANREHARLVEKQAEREKMEREAMIEENMAAASGKNLGEETFKNVCMQCHRMNEKLVGPPLATVLPKYASNPEELQNFVLNPVKKDPAYPPMPNPGLSPAQARAVAAYLLGQMAGGAESGAPDGQTSTQTEVESGQTSH
ncbi:MAG TPA: cytochrome c [Candidatus Krumholzibacteria bacterium]|nr:cytochrome c [Candidatus Krumholzibacteria bacterium]